MAAQQTLKPAIVAAVVYIAIMATGMALTGHGFGITYGDPKMVKVLVFFEVALTVWAVASARRIFGAWHCGFGPIDWRGMVWLLPNFALIAAMFHAVLSAPGVQMNGLIVAIILTMILVGISEELMFRGVLLQAALREVSMGKAILISSIGFSLLHSVNVLAFVPVVGMVQQLGLTFVFGLALACYALRANSLVPVMVFHALWDMVQFLGGVFSADFGQLINIGILVNTAIAAVLWLLVLRPRAGAAAPAA